METRSEPTQSLSGSLKECYKEIKHKISDVTSDVLPQYCDVICMYLAEHPYVALTLAAIAITCIIPIIVFLLFAGLSIFVTFFLFFAAEGTLILIGFAILVAVILILCSILLIGLATATVAWHIFSQLSEGINLPFDVDPSTSPRNKRR